MDRQTITAWRGEHLICAWVAGDVWRLWFSAEPPKRSALTLAVHRQQRALYSPTWEKPPMLCAINAQFIPSSITAYWRSSSLAASADGGVTDSVILPIVPLNLLAPSL